MRRPPTSPAQFSDVSQILDTALAAGGGRYVLSTPGKAVRWRQRAYSLRKLLHKIDAERKQAVPGAIATSPYDLMFLRIIPDDLCAVQIEIRKPEGTLTAFDGGALPLAPIQSIPTGDPFAEAAEELIRSLGLPANRDHGAS